MASLTSDIWQVVSDRRRSSDSFTESCPGRDDHVSSASYWIQDKIRRSLMGPIYRILPNKCACLNKRAPNFWFYLATSQKLLKRSESNFEHTMLRYSRLHTSNFIEIRQGWGFVLCLRTWHFYLAKYGSILWNNHHSINDSRHLLSDNQSWTDSGQW